MDAAKLRELQQRAHELMELMRSGREGEGDESALSYTPHILELARVVYKVDETSKRVTDDDVRKIWEKRATWLHQELQRVLAERLQNAQQAGHDFWDACVRLLYASASSVEAAQAERAELETRLKKEQAAAVDREAQHHAAAQEALEMRTKLALKSQEAAAQEADHRELLQRLQAALRERDVLRADKAQLLEERESNREHMSRQTEVISQLMERNEAVSREKLESLKLASKTESDNHVLRVNLGQHGQVVEKLIHLNVELMEEKNARTVAKVRESAPGAATQLEPQGGDQGQQGGGPGADASSWPHTHGPPRPGQGAAAAPVVVQGRAAYPLGANACANGGTNGPLALPNGQPAQPPPDRRVVDTGSDEEPLLPPSVPPGAATPPLSQGRWGGSLSTVTNGWMGSRGAGMAASAGGAPGPDTSASAQAGAGSLAAAGKVDRDGQGGAKSKGMDLESGIGGHPSAPNPVTNPRAIRWTSDALPLLRQNQTQANPRDEKDGTESEGSGKGGGVATLEPRLDAAWSKVKVVKQGVAGKTRGLMSYIAGADVAQSVGS